MVSAVEFLTIGSFLTDFTVSHESGDNGIGYC